MMLARYLSVCEEAARAAGQVLREQIGRAAVRTKSSPRDLVTEADTAAQSVIEKIVLGTFPEHGFIGEENHSAKQRVADTEFCWVVDPLDGTTNFVHGCPMFGPSIGLVHTVEGQSEVLCGVFYNPMLDEFFSAAKGQGVFLNGKRVAASSCRSAEESLVSVSFSANAGTKSDDFAAFTKALPVCQSIRRTGSTAMNLAYVAAGRFDSTWAYTCHPWDIAGGVLLVLEAGGTVSQPDGSPLTFDNPSPIAASANAGLHRKIIEVLQCTF